MIIVNLAHPVWKEDGSFSGGKYYGVDGKTPIEKFNIASGISSKSFAYLKGIIGWHYVTKIMNINDGTYQDESGVTLSSLDGPDHTKALQLLFEELKKHPDKVKVIENDIK